MNLKQADDSQSLSLSALLIGVRGSDAPWGGSAYLAFLFQLFALQILSCVLASACGEVLVLWKAALVTGQPRSVLTGNVVESWGSGARGGLTVLCMPCPHTVQLTGRRLCSNSGCYKIIWE